MIKLIKYLLIIFLIMLLAVITLFTIHILNGDDDATYELRGRYKTSLDGKTYLVIEDNNGGNCGPLLVDKKEWPYGLNAKGEVKPGEHRIECGGWRGISIQKGTTYYFDYWGP
ncbi:hypothetical protein OIZ54_00135 [Pseudoalteromonas sp. A3]|uniref:hypothetical protein n=1 Tax=unclassified Pseudoalteromonas TaxID=194690 RepID=UPI002220B5BB|nr:MULTISPECIES: hypothetical protein [unclassified Pseudoalteromonas]MCW1717150.1 hypothetical protein [Pseudoalteromonas sp. A3]MDC9512062.1 hypothetical protein [Pseudoalteromonas sp. CST1]MDC9536298.1 hypothetical protein [Pseudoalteromonas sp. CST3]MDC9540339.1 hypothetical protein [Pseudoalteromonas sp. CST2]MDC9546786.1 hypothetical protein [Pseudoalteromonas sp. CST4]